MVLLSCILRLFHFFSVYIVENRYKGELKWKTSPRYLHKP